MNYRMFAMMSAKRLHLLLSVTPVRTLLFEIGLSHTEPRGPRGRRSWHEQSRQGPSLGPRGENSVVSVVVVVPPQHFKSVYLFSDLYSS